MGVGGCGAIVVLRIGRFKFFRLNENDVAVAAAELSAGAVLALSDVNLTWSCEMEMRALVAALRRVVVAEGVMSPARVAMRSWVEGLGGQWLR